MCDEAGMKERKEQWRRSQSKRRKNKKCIQIVLEQQLWENFRRHCASTPMSHRIEQLIRLDLSGEYPQPSRHGTSEAKIFRHSDDDDDFFNREDIDNLKADLDSQICDAFEQLEFRLELYGFSAKAAAQINMVVRSILPSWSNESGGALFDMHGDPAPTS
jgi:hypothetical protein